MKSVLKSIKLIDALILAMAVWIVIGIDFGNMSVMASILRDTLTSPLRWSVHCVCSTELSPPTLPLTVFSLSTNKILF